jgi:hypothetical protein
VFDYALIEKKNDKGEFNGLSLSVKITAAEVWMTPEGATDPAWLDCLAWDAHGEGYIVLISKAGKVNENQINRLIKHANWDGDFQSLADHAWEPTPIRFDIQAKEYNGEVSYRINWINAFDSEPGGAGGNVDADRAKALNSQYGAAIRALRGNQTRAATPPAAGKPQAPATPRKPPQRKPAAANGGSAAAPVAPPQDGGGDIPF